MSSRLAAVLLALAPLASAGTLVLTPAQDGTLYEYPQGNVSNGAGDWLFAGRTNADQLRRGLLRFDVASALPAGATVTAVELRLVMSKTLITLPKACTLHRALAPWGEGATDAAGEEGEGALALPGDATWTRRFFPGTSWAVPGGDFVAAPSASADVGPIGSYTWFSTAGSSTAGLVADVQLWLDEPASDHGWVLLCAEGEGQTAKRFNSRQHPEAGTHPMLVVSFDPPAGCAGAGEPYGSSLAGAGGLASTLAAGGCPQAGGSFELRLAHGVGGAAGWLFAGLAPAALPFKGGQFLVAVPAAQVALVLGGPAGEPGAGELVLPVTLPPDARLSGTTLFLQAGFGDALAPQGAALGNGLALVIG